VRSHERRSIGIWSEIRAGQRWKNEGVSRVLGFIIEGAAERGDYTFHVFVQHGLAEEVRDDLRTLRAKEGEDWVVHEPSVADVRNWSTDLAFADLDLNAKLAARTALMANMLVDVEGWIVSFPHFAGALYLDKPKAVLMPDAIGYDFPDGWQGDQNWGENGYLVTWRETATKVLAGCDAVMTFSSHVAHRHVVKLLDTPIEKVVPIPLAPPDLAVNLPFIVNRRKTLQSLQCSADILREYASASGNDYMVDFPFEEVQFVVTATQDRPTKNLGRVAEAVRRIVRDRRRSMKMITTANIHYGESWSLLPFFAENSGLLRDVISMRDVPRTVHAALFHSAAVTVHPTMFEGIIGSLPFFESVSVGTPCLLGRGPHVKELLSFEPSLERFTFDPYDIDSMVNLIEEVASHPDDALDIQRPAFERLSRYGWGDVADAYVRAATLGVSAGPSPDAIRFGG
jgi:glycosyltransferase involved in cell wall biosynthesis